MTQIFMPLVGNTGAPGDVGTVPAGVAVPFGYALYGVDHVVQHAKLAAGYPVQCWSPPECCFAYPTFYPALWGTRWWTPIERIRELAAAHPGRTWLLWNEPEPEFGFGPLPERDQGQACISPTNARDITIEWVEAIRASGGKIAGWGCTVTSDSHWTNNAWQKWMEQAQRLDFPKPDFYHYHVYATKLAEWKKQHEKFQSWNYTVGGNLPTIISECGGGEEIYRYLQTWQDPRVLACMWFTRFNAAEDPYLSAIGA